MEVQQGPADTARPVYEEFLKVFPTAGRYWKYYAEHEIQAGNFDQAEKVFMQSLPSCPNIDLWKTYIKYILDHKAKHSGQRDTVLKAFDFAIAHVGMDVRSSDRFRSLLSDRSCRFLLLHCGLTTLPLCVTTEQVRSSKNRKRWTSFESCINEQSKFRCTMLRRCGASMISSRTA